MNPTITAEPEYCADPPAILESAMSRRHTRTPTSVFVPTRFAPVELAPLPELQAAAAAAPTVRRLRALVEWLGEGRRLTAAGNLTLADGKELARLLGLVDPDRLAGPGVRSARDIPGVELLVGWAKQLRLARAQKGWLVPVEQHPRLLDDPLDLCRQAVSVLPLLLPGLPITDVIGSSFPGGLAEALLHLLSQLYLSSEPVTAGELAVHFWEGHVEPLLDEAASRPEPWRLATAFEVTLQLSLLWGLGMVEVSDESGAQVTEVYLSPLAEVWLRLTPLGSWCANVLLRTAGAVAPVIGELAEADVATLIEGLSGYGERAYRAELRAWCLEHGPGAVRELAGYARAAPGFHQRLRAFAGLREAGPAAEAEVRSMLADSELRPYAQLWLTGQGLEGPSFLDPDSAGVLLAEKLASVLKESGPDALVELLEQVGRQVDQAAVLARMWRAKTPGAAAVLEAAGKAHPAPTWRPG